MPKRFVYVLKNSDVPPRYDTGLSANVSNRLVEHNAGNNMHTAKYRAVAFERCLKSGQVPR